MSLTNIIVTSLSTLEAEISADDFRVSWGSYISDTVNIGGEYTTTFIGNNEIALATYLTGPSAGMAVTWNDPTPPLTSNFISLTATQDNISIFLSATNLLGDIVSGSFFNPYFIQLSTVSSNLLTASYLCQYEQVSTGNIIPVPPDTEIIWEFLPATTGFRGGLSSEFNSIDIFNNNVISGYSLSASVITYTYNGLVYNQDAYIVCYINDKYYTNMYDEIDYTEPVQYYMFNPSIEIFVSDNYTNYTILCAIQNSVYPQSDTMLKWEATPTTGIIALTGSGLVGEYTLGDSGESLYLNTIKLSTSDLWREYVYTLSSYTGEVSGIFRPFSDTTVDLTLTASHSLIDTQDNIDTYRIKGYGITTNILHNMEPGQYIVWSSSDPNLYAFYNDNESSYILGTVDTANNIDNINIILTKPVVTTTPNICSASFVICALSSSQIADGIVAVYNFNIPYTEWFDENFLNATFKFQFDPENLDTIYRPISTGIYTIYSTSTLPSDSFGTIVFTFNDAVCSLNFDKRFNPDQQIFVEHPFSTVTECVCTINMTAFVSGTGWVFEKTAKPKSIVFAQIPDASNFKAYPEFMWDGGAWQQVVNSAGTDTGEVLIPGAPLSAYGLCHTENFFLSSQTLTGIQYNWSIQPVDTYNNNQTVTINNTAWVSLKTDASTQYYSICSSIFTNILPPSMPSKYYDTIEGVRFDNFYVTPSSSYIRIINNEDLGIIPSISDVNSNQLPVPHNLIVTGVYATGSNTPFDIFLNDFYLIYNTDFWAVSTSTPGDTGTIINSVYINVDDIGNSYFGVPKNEITTINITPAITYNIRIKTLNKHPSANDWCVNPYTYFNISCSVAVSAYPVLPLIYNSNYYITTGAIAKYENLIQCFSAIQSIEWTDHNNKLIFNTCAPYITSYNGVGGYGISLKNNYLYSDTLQSLYRTFDNMSTVLNEYTPHNSNYSRVIGVTNLEFPYNKQSCQMPPNEWVVRDTFNSSIIKLHNNLEYLKNMSKAYDIPPTDYIGWYGSTYYNNNVERTRWFTKAPHNNYAYNKPIYAINYDFNDIQDVYTRNNYMYISDGTSVHIVSSDAQGTQMSIRNYKTIGDDFTCVRSIQLDSEGRIYLLDSYNSNNNIGSKNRIVVYNFNTANLQWTMLYEWGGLGGAGAKTKFNNPSDMYIDEKDTIWVADTNNNCIKHYTRTGSWLNTLVSGYIDKPMSVTIYDDNIYILTSNSIVKFSSEFEYISTYNIPSGALKIEKSQDGGFLYITYTDKILKTNLIGELVGTIAENDFSDYNKHYRSCFHDEYRNLYILNQNHILKYVDLLSIVSIVLEKEAEVWELNQLLVGKNEYIQDWVINRCVQRLWDNIEIFRCSLLGKFGYKTIKTVTSTTITSAIDIPPDFPYCTEDWLYDYSRNITIDTETEYQKPVVRTFTSDEYKILPHTKESIYVGLNEINSADVYNRLFNKLYECEETILQMIAI